MRAGEIAALRMKRVDLLRGRVRVEESLSEVSQVQYLLPPKTGEARTVTLPASLTPMLRDYLDTQPPKGLEDFLFTGEDSANPAAPLRHNSRFYPATFLPAVRRAGLTGLRFHDLRHTCAALLIAENVPPKAIQDHLGHATFSMTMDTYGRLSPAATQPVTDALERAFAVNLG